MKKKYVSCTIKQLPEKELIAAARTAIGINPCNAAPVHQTRIIENEMSAAGIDVPAFIAILTTKYWGSAGVHLTVGFLSQASAALQEKILSHMNAWNRYCNVDFQITSGAARNAQVRISLGAGGYYSYLGTDVAHIPASQQTMNLQGFTVNTPDSEYRRVVRHETGHTLGAPHEHMRQELVNRLDPQKTIAYFMRTQGWSAAEVQQQVLTPLEESSLMGTPHAEQTSIMCYELPATITTDGRPIQGGSDITMDDGEFLGKLYPLAVTPPPPPASSLAVTLAVAGYKTTTVNMEKV